MSGSEIAIIGITCRFPGARNLDQFWKNLCDGVESITFLSDDEIEPSIVDPASPRDPNYVKAASILEDVDLFDAAFFGYTPMEAEVMDPQHRVFLECAWEALDDAGYDPETYEGAIGVFAGARTNAYLFNLFSNSSKVRSLGAFEIGLGNDLAFLPTRVSYKLNLRGPSYAVHTACSTSLVAVHLACQSLLIDECQMALAGGIAINVPQRTGYLYMQGGIVSPDGHCRAFDEQSQGTLFGSGVGIVVLKRLEDALTDGDTIHAIIKGSAVNNDGSSKASFTAPSVHGQAAVIMEALANAGVAPETITYVETHGTGTAIGDQIEIRGLTKAFGRRTQAKNHCAIGSVKTNLGHLDAAAGIASLIKTAFALKHKGLPPSLHFERPNQNIALENTPFYVQKQLSDWKTNGHPRRAGVSAFGVGGANAHVILEEAPPVEESKGSKNFHLLVWSAKSIAALDQATINLLDHLKRRPDLNLADAAYTLQVGRKHFKHRRAMICRDVADAIQSLESLDFKRVLSSIQEISDRPVVFMFPGGGAQYVNMGKDLYGSEPVFREEIDRCCVILKDQLGYDMRELLFVSEEKRAAASERLERTSVALPALFAIEYAMAKLLISWGIRPEAMIGHSLGEYVAACLAGVFSLADALAIVVLRGQLFETLPRGAMLSVFLPESEVLPLIGERLSIAAINSPSQCVISGPAEAIDEVVESLSARGGDFRRIHIVVAAHSEMVTPIQDQFRKLIEQFELRAPTIPFISNVTGTWVTREEATDPAYWAKHLRQPVRFADGLQELMKEANRILLEVGPGQGLSTLAKLQNDPLRDRVVLSTIRHPYERQSDEAFLLTTLGKMWLSGAEVHWPGLYANERRRRIPLPAYPFERQRYWISPADGGDDQAGRQNVSGKKAELADWFYRPSWKVTAPVAQFQTPSAEKIARRWLILGLDGDLSESITRRLEAGGDEVILAQAGESYRRISEGSYTINPGRREEYHTIFEELRESGRLPTDILHLWSMTGDGSEPPGIERFKKAQETGYYSLLYLAQAMAAHAITTPLQLWIITSGLHEAESGDRARPEKATMLGPGKVIPQEFQNIASHCIDVMVPQPGAPEESRLLDQLMAEFNARSSDLVIAYRGKRRWAQSFEPVRLLSEVKEIRSLRAGGVYLITGGLGGVGLLLAQYLARTVKAKLALVGRSPFPDRSEWETNLATHDEDDLTSYRIRKVLAMEEYGAEVMLASIDVANPEQVEFLINEVYARFGQINGVIHAAGTTSGPSVFNPLTEIGPAESELQFQPKVYGLYALEQALRGKEIDFCMLISSNSSVLGGMGFVAYGAANAFMDAFADASNQAGGTSWISASWDPWPQETKKYAEAQTSMDRYTMTKEECVEAFHRIVSMIAGGHVVVATGDLPARLRLWVNRDDTAGGKMTGDSHPRPAIHSIYVAPSNKTEQIIADIWRQILGVEQVGIYDSFFDLGGHSLLATRLVAQLRESFNIDFPLQKFFEAPTVSGLALAISQAKADQEDLEKVAILSLLEQLSEEEVDVEISKRK